MKMFESKKSLSELAQDLASGQSGAEVRLQKELRPQLARMVRRALHCTSANSAVARRVLDLAGRKAASLSQNSGNVVRQVAQSLCASVIENLRPPLEIQETVFS
jgi:hypothetical protein